MTRNLAPVCIAVALATFCQAQQPHPQVSGTTENLRGLSTPINGIAWASGTHGTFLRTIDGGEHWQSAQVHGAESLDFRDVEAFDASVAFLLSAGPGDQSRIYKTSDAGQHWDLQFMNTAPQGFFDCMAFWDGEHGIALGDPVDGKFELIATSDGGKSWKPLPGDHIPPAVEGEGAFAASGSCLTVNGNRDVWFATGGKVARVLHSRDRGATWTVATTPILQGEASTGIFSIAFRDARHGAISGGDYKKPEHGSANVAVTQDGGASWKLLPGVPQAYFSSAAYDPSHGDRLLLAGTKFYVDFRAGGNGFGHAPTQTWPLNLNSIAFWPDGTALAVGPAGAIVYQTLRKQK